MRCLQRIGRWGRLAFLMMTGWLAVHGTALAEPPQQKQEPEGGSYVVSYMLVILAIAMGMLFVCRSSRRRDRAKPEQYDESKVM